LFCVAPPCSAPISLPVDGLMMRLRPVLLVAVDCFTTRDVHVVVHAALGAMLLLTRLVLVPVPVQTLVYTQSILYVGAHRSLAMLDRDSEPGEALQVEALSWREGALGPAFWLTITLSVCITYRCFGAQQVILLFTMYFSCVCTVAFAESIRPIILAFLSEEARRRTVHFKLPVLPSKLVPRRDGENVWVVRFGKDRILAYAAAVLTSVAHLYTGDWTLHNTFVISLALQVLTHVSLGRFAVGVGLLGGMLLCDALWVFGSPAAPALATDFSGAVQVLLPVSWDPWRQVTIGFGDIAVPGILVAMCLRFDAHTHLVSGGEAVSLLSDFSKPYFLSACCAYLLAKLVSGAILSGSALLYLVPATVCAPIALGYTRGQIRDLFAYNEEELMPKRGSESSKQR